MNLWPFRKPSLSDSARHMGKLGAQVRQERERQRIRAVAREMRVKAGLPPLKALEG